MQKSRSISAALKNASVANTSSNLLERALRFRSALPLLFSAAVLTSASIASAMTITGVDNSSRPIDLTLTPIQIYGGVAGPTGSNGTGTSDSCAVTTSSFQPCNPARVDAGTVLRIHTNTTATTVGYPRMFFISGSSTTGGATGTVVQQDGSNPPSAGAGDSYVAVTWGQICQSLGDPNLSNQCVHGTGSTQAISGTFRIGYTTGIGDTTLPTADTVDIKIVVNGYMGFTSNTSDVFMSDCGEGTYNQYGICAFQMTAGDEKATITSPHADQGITGPALQFSGVRVLYEKVADFNNPSAAFTAITAKSPHQDLSLSTDANGNLSIGGSGRVTGLNNDQTYAFKLGMIDLAGNIGLYTNSAATANSGDNYCPDSNRSTNCHLATPEEVVGVLSKNLSCFIATAAYGSQMAPEVDTFRAFRNQFLLTNKWGTKFVRFYYHYSPKYANIIAHSETLRSIARLFLWPLLGYAWLALHIGAKYAFALLALFLGSIFLIGYRFMNSQDDEDGGPQGSQRA